MCCCSLAPVVLAVQFLTTLQRYDASVLQVIGICDLKSHAVTCSLSYTCRGQIGSDQTMLHFALSSDFAIHGVVHELIQCTGIL
jgi:hypothetical protein